MNVFISTHILGKCSGIFIIFDIPKIVKVISVSVVVRGAAESVTNTMHDIGKLLHCSLPKVLLRDL